MAKMNNNENEILYKEVLDFSKDDNSPAGRAAKQLADALAERLEHTMFDSEQLSDDCVSLLTIKAEKFNLLKNDVIIKILKRCKDNGKSDVIQRFTDICTASFFDISLKKLSLLGEQFALLGFICESVRCYERATEIVKESGTKVDEAKAD